MQHGLAAIRELLNQLTAVAPARTVFDAKDHPAPYYNGRDFWTLAAGLLAENARAEAGLLPTAALPGDALGGVRERECICRAPSGGPPRRAGGAGLNRAACKAL